jgi:soluble lytic murein transglycosylase-like protein
MSGSAWEIFGPAAPVADLAAQIEQESSWKIGARSWAGAEGFAQFMPATAKDMARRFPEACAPANPYSPAWAFACRDRYLKSLIKATPGDDDCDTWAFGFRAYNGGLGWIRKDRALTAANGKNPNDWQTVAWFNAGRSLSAHNENTNYPKHIFRLENKYSAWGNPLKCLP